MGSTTMTISIHVYRVMFVLAWLAVAFLALSKANAADDLKGAGTGDRAGAAHCDERALSPPPNS